MKFNAMTGKDILETKVYLEISIVLAIACSLQRIFVLFFFLNFPYVKSKLCLRLNIYSKDV